MSEYLNVADFRAQRESALDTFHRMLTRRWREQAIEAIMHNRPLALQSPGRSSWLAPAWSYSSVPARAHIDPGNCRYVDWVLAGQAGPLESAHCDGLVTETTWLDPRTGVHVPVGPAIDCGVGKVLRQVEDWAWAERSSLFGRMPAFDDHDLSALHAAFDDLAAIADALDVYRGGREALEGGRPADTRAMRDVVTTVHNHIGERPGWLIDWTGLAAQRAGSFLESTKPTMSNQCQIARAMAKLWSDRAAIIEKGRRDSLAWLDWAIGCLTETAEIPRASGWVTVQAIGEGVAVAGLLNPKLAVTGGSIALVGFLGDNLFPAAFDVAYVNRVEEVLATLHEGIDRLQIALDGHEQEYRRAATLLRDWVHSTHSYNLELYDLTRNDPTGSGDGFSVDVDWVLWLATQCYELGLGYDELRPVLARTADSDPHLAGADGRPTAGDTTLTAIRGLLESFLRTTAARYHLAADQLEAAAHAYAATDAEARRRLEEVLQQGRDPLPPVAGDRMTAAVATERRPRFSLYDPSGSGRLPDGVGLVREPGWDHPDSDYVTEDE